MKTYKIHPEALGEIDNSIRFYEEKQPGLGVRFPDAVEDGILKVRRNPFVYRKIGQEIRKCRVT